MMVARLKLSSLGSKGRRDAVCSIRVDGHRRWGVDEDVEEEEEETRSQKKSKSILKT